MDWRQVPQVRPTVYRNRRLIWFSVAALLIVAGLLAADRTLLGLEITAVLAALVLLWMGLQFRLAITPCGLRVCTVRCRFVAWDDLESVTLGQDRWGAEGVELTVGGRSFLAPVPAVRARGIWRNLGRARVMQAIADIQQAHQDWLSRDAATHRSDDTHAAEAE